MPGICSIWQKFVTRPAGRRTLSAPIGVVRITAPRPAPDLASTADPGLRLPPAAAPLPPEPDGERLARLAAWCEEGRLDAAELELHDWRREAHCPPASMLLLASLLARRGADDDALTILRRSRRQGADDPAGAMLITALLAADGRTDSARDALLDLFHRHGDDPLVATWIRAIELPGTAELPAAPDAQIERLATELLHRPAIVPTLVAAQKARPVATDIALLRQSIAQMLQSAERENPDLDRLSLCQALAELALLAEDLDDARRWAQRGLRINPFAAPLALVLARIPDDQTIGPPALEVLKGAVEAHGAYADLKAALVRRQRHEGLGDEARLTLERWLAEQPDHPLALRLQRETAA